MLVRRLALTLLFVATGALAQATPTATTTDATKKAADKPTATNKAATDKAAADKGAADKAAADKVVADKAAADKAAADKAAADKAMADKAAANKDESKQPTGADGTKAPAVTIDVVILPPVPTSPGELTERSEKADKNEVEARLGDSIVLVSKKPDELKAYVAWASNHSKVVTLYINGIDTGTTPEAYPTNDALQFQLEKRTSANKKVWSALLRDPFLNQDSFLHKVRPNVTATIGVDHGEAAPTHAHFKLIVVKFVWYAWLWLIALIAFLIAIFILAKKYGLLRDGAPVAGVPPPYSLGRCQMAWWFVLIIVSYVLIWLISGDPDTITASLLGLMGISAGTALGAALIETSTSGPASLSQAAADRLAFEAALKKAQQDLKTAQDAAEAAPGDPVVQKAAADAQAAVDVVKQKLNDANNRLGAVTKPPKTSWWLREILSDSDGNIVLHRFQIVVWTIVLGIMFLVSVVTELTMPEFSPTLLATMGISAGTYLGFKFPEK